MSKVDCLRKIIAKMTGMDEVDPEIDTVCECLDKIADVISTVISSGGTSDTKWFVVDQNLMSGSNAPVGAKEGDLVLDNQGDVFEVDEDLQVTSTGVNLKGPSA